MTVKHRIVDGLPMLSRVLLRKASMTDGGGMARTIVAGVVIGDLCPDEVDRIMIGHLTLESRDTYLFPAGREGYRVDQILTSSEFGSLRGMKVER